MSPGEIYWVDLPGVSGREQRGRGPAIVLQDELSVGELPVVIVIPLTTARATLRFTGTTSIAATSESGLRSRSVALVFQVRAVDRKRIRDLVGEVSVEELAAIFAELDRLTGRK